MSGKNAYSEPEIVLVNNRRQFEQAISQGKTFIQDRKEYIYSTVLLTCTRIHRDKELTQIKEQLWVYTTYKMKKRPAQKGPDGVDIPIYAYLVYPEKRKKKKERKVKR